MTSHIHLSILSVLSISAVCILTSFMMHQLSLILVTSDSEGKQLFGKAIAGGFGF